tara:strand:+ start:179 stop:433 length:255 start_codon:yes stop_codon:yes gene_type:complete
MTVEQATIQFLQEGLRRVAYQAAESLAYYNVDLASLRHDLVYKGINSIFELACEKSALNSNKVREDANNRVIPVKNTTEENKND